VPRPTLTALAAAALLAGLAGCGGKGGGAEGWPLPGADLAGTRAAASSLDSGNVGRLEVRWRFALTAPQTPAGIFASTPVADASTVYVQDLQSNVYALDRASGRPRWVRRFHARNEGPNGLALDGDAVFGATDADAFALSRKTGRLLWQRHLTSATEQFVDVAPVVWKGLVFLGTVGYPPGGRGAVYALDAATGAVRWRFDTIAEPWAHPDEAGGGGIWYPVSIDGDGRLYAGTANPAPWGGTRARPNGGAFPGPVRYTDSLLVLDARTGRLLWHDQVTPHDVRDHDFQATPVLATVDGDPLVVGAGKGGRVIAWDRTTRTRRWTAVVGLHRHDAGPLPARPVEVCPGLLGGVETPMALAGGRVFVPVVDLCVRSSATTHPDVTALDPTKGRGRLVALDAGSGRRLWERRFPSPVFSCATAAGDLVFTGTFDGTVFALSARDGEVVWRARLRAGLNGCPLVVGDLVVFGAGVPLGTVTTPEIVAYSLP
jgi:alcohol dehydrogenase (cytochrome c)